VGPHRQRLLDSALRGNPGQVNYAAAKAGLIGATRSLSLELAKRQHHGECRGARARRRPI
jgi:hypothetical protein